MAGLGGLGWTVLRFAGCGLTMGHCTRVAKPANNLAETPEIQTKSNASLES